MGKHIGILTSGGDCPGLNAAIRGIGKAGISGFDMQFLGFRNGFNRLVHDRTMKLDNEMLSGILTDGGTILGHGAMMSVRGSEVVPVPLEEVAGNKKKLVPRDHPLVGTARMVGTCLGD